MPDRQDVLRSIANLNSVRKVSLPSTPSDRDSSAAGVVQAGGVQRVRDRQNAEANTPVEARPETQFEQELRLHGDWAYVWRAERQKDEKKKRREEEAALLEQKKKWKIENDERVRKEMAARTVSILFANENRRQVKQMFADVDATGDEITEVIKRVRADHAEMMLSAYETHLTALRAEAAKK